MEDNSVIEHGDFMIISKNIDDEYCTILHVPSFKALFFAFPPRFIHEKMKNDPDSLNELKDLIINGLSG